MKRFAREKQAHIISTLIEGCSIRATSRMFGVSKDTVLKLQARTSAFEVRGVSWLASI